MARKREKRNKPKTQAHTQMQLEAVFMCPSHYQPRVIFRPPRGLWQCLEILIAWGSRPQWTAKHLPCLGQPPYQRFVVFLAHKSRLSLCNAMDCSPPGYSVHEISQARILEWVAISFSRGSSQPRDFTHVSCIGRQILYHWATWEALSESKCQQCLDWETWNFIPKMNLQKTSIPHQLDSHWWWYLKIHHTRLS